MSSCDSHAWSSSRANIAIDCDDYGWSALHHAVFAQQLDAVKRQLRVGAANVNAASSEFRDGFPAKSTPLHICSRGGSFEIFLYLIENGADINAEDADDWTCLHWAASMGHAEIIECLAFCGVDIEQRNGFG